MSCSPRVGCVKSAADAVRRRYVTMIAGQEMLYLRKEAEARAYLADPNPADYPLIMAEVGITAPEAWHVAQVYLGLSAVWISLAAPLETARLGAIAQIEVAEDAETILLSINDVPEVREIFGRFRMAQANTTYSISGHAGGNATPRPELLVSNWTLEPDS